MICLVPLFTVSAFYLEEVFVDREMCGKGKARFFGKNIIYVIVGTPRFWYAMMLLFIMLNS